VPSYNEEETYVTITDNNFYKAMYKGTVISNAQAFVAKAIKEGDFDANPHLSIKRNTISSKTLEWIEAMPGTEESYLHSLLDSTDFICNGDVMFHVNKGAIGLRIDNV
jgi:hypothetical protein